VSLFSLAMTPAYQFQCHGGLNLLQYSQIFHSVPTAAAWYDASLFKCSICPDFIDTSNDRLRRHLSSCHEGMTVFIMDLEDL
jgi:hypothetical protein